METVIVWRDTEALGDGGAVHDPRDERWGYVQELLGGFKCIVFLDDEKHLIRVTPKADGLHLSWRGGHIILEPDGDAATWCVQ